MFWLAVLLLLVVVFLCVAFYTRRRSANHDEPAAEPSGECCGQHAVCERDSLLAGVSKQIDYYDDEELDRFKGRPAASYTSAEVEEFRDILYTMRDDDVAGWCRSLQLRGVELPEPLKDEVLLIVGENRFYNLDK